MNDATRGPTKDRKWTLMGKGHHHHTLAGLRLKAKPYTHQWRDTRGYKYLCRNGVCHLVVDLKVQDARRLVDVNGGRFGGGGPWQGSAPLNGGRHRTGGVSG